MKLHVGGQLVSSLVRLVLHGAQQVLVQTLGVKLNGLEYQLRSYRLLLPGQLHRRLLLQERRGR